MTTGQDRRRNFWAGRAVFVVVMVALVIYVAVIGLDRANKLAGVIGVLLALCALVAPYLLPAADGRTTSRSGADRAEDTGKAGATGGGDANTGVQTGHQDGPARVRRTGNATAEGRKSNANTGIQRRSWWRR